MLRLGDLAEDEVVALSIGLDSWPYSGLICRFLGARNRLVCDDHSPPKSTGLTFAEGELLWQSQFGISALDDRGAYRFVSDPIFPGGFHIDDENLWVTDRRGGRLLRIDLSNTDGTP